MCKILKLAYYRNYRTDSNQILHSYKDHQILFVGGPNTREVNPRWRTAAILETVKSQYLSNRLAAGREIWHDDDDALNFTVQTHIVLRNKTAKIIKTKTGFSFSS